MAGDANLLAQVRSPLLPVLLPFFVLLQPLLLAAEVFVIAVLDHCCIERLCFVHRNGVFGARAVERKGGGAGGVLFGGIGFRIAVITNRCASGGVAVLSIPR
jgi:apolipoprotein N-acyltransferase